MLLTITTTHQPATDLGYLLHKHPARLQSFGLAFGQAHVFYPEATDARCTAALLLEVDPIGLVRGRGATSDQYVNDRPYVASSFLSVALAEVFRSALAGNCKDRPALVDQPLPLEATIAALPCRGGDEILERLFAPLGYRVASEGRPLDPRFPDWGESPYRTVTLSGTTRLRDLLAHLYVLIPVLDNEKHYYVGDDEVEKLLRRGEGWLGAHPERDLIARRYLKHQRSLTDEALARLVAAEVPDPDAAEERHAGEEEAAERRISLNEQRLGAVVAADHRSRLRGGAAARGAAEEYRRHRDRRRRCGAPRPGARGGAAAARPPAADPGGARPADAGGADLPGRSPRGLRRRRSSPLC